MNKPHHKIVDVVLFEKHGPCNVRLPHAARLLSVNMHGGVLRLYALADDSEETVQRMLYVAVGGTTQPPVPPDRPFVGSTGGHHASMVHVFDLGEVGA